jgi:hypothetical protein
MPLRYVVVLVVLACVAVLAVASVAAKSSGCLNDEARAGSVV